jgi:hypothetical protein
VRFRAEDNSLHLPSADPYWNESAFFAVIVPELNIDGFVYVWHRPNMRLSASGVALWNDVGSHTDDCLYYDFTHLQAMEPGSDMFNFSLDGGLAIRCEEPGRAYAITYRGDGCELDLVWRGVIDPQPLHFVENEGPQAWGDQHYEQAGRLTGVVTIEGESIEINCLNMRDHSWGSRPPHAGRVSSGGFEWANASETSGFCLTSMREEPLDAQQFTGTTDAVRYGFYTRDGIVSPVRRGTRRVLERTASGRPLRLLIEATDELGRELVAEGTCTNALHYKDLWFAYWGLVQWDFDAQTGWGETQDFFSPRQIRRFQRDLQTSSPAANVR